MIESSTCPPGDGPSCRCAIAASAKAAREIASGPTAATLPARHGARKSITSGAVGAARACDRARYHTTVAAVEFRQHPSRFCTMSIRTDRLELIPASLELVDVAMQGDAALAGALGVQLPSS